MLPATKRQHHQNVHSAEAENPTDIYRKFFGFVFCFGGCPVAYEVPAVLGWGSNPRPGDAEMLLILRRPSSS